MFEATLRPLLSLPGARGVVFCDETGETVQAFGASGRSAPEEADDFELRVTGAQFATPIDEVIHKARENLGVLREVLLRGTGESLLVHVLPDGYYLILVLSPEALTGPAFFMLRTVARQVATEI